MDGRGRGEAKMVNHMFTAAMSLTLLSAPAMISATEPAGAPASVEEVQGDRTSDLEMLLAEFATTPEQHRALARYFQEKAEEHREVADKHGAMAQSYSSGKVRDAELVREHSKKIAEREAAIAAEYEAMAKVHQTEANR
jgi:hypothetical protein